MSLALYEGDNRDHLRRLIDEGVRIHSVVTDPPYGLVSTTKRFGKDGAAPARFGKDGAFARASAGFMGQCYHPDTDVLTTRGWKPVGEIVAGEIVATLNPSTEHLVWQTVIATPSFEFDGNLIHIAHRSAEQMVTPNHKILAADRRDQQPWLRTPDSLQRTFYQTAQANPCPGLRWPITIDVVRPYGTRGETRRETRHFEPGPFFRFFGLWLGDGYVASRKNDHPANDFFGFSVSKQRKVTAIRAALVDLGIRFTETSVRGKVSFYCYDFALLEWLRPLGGALTKHIPVELFSWDAQCLEHLYLGLIDTDGTRQGKNQELFFTSSRQLADDFQRLCLQTGRSAAFYKRNPNIQPTINGRAIRSTTPGYTLCVLQGSKRLYGENGTCRNGDVVSRQPYRGPVHCLSVAQHHTLYTRFNGKPVWSGNSWDGTGIERDPEFWRLIWEILLPGGYCLAFSSPRTGHWQACAMEMAGFVMHPFLGWVTGQGFPKAHNAAKAIDATLLTGKMRTEDMRRIAMGDDYEPSGRGRINYDNGGGSKMNGATGPSSPRTDEAAKWNGWAYGGQALKPALEPIYVGQKPFSEKNGALNLLKHGVGAVNVDGCRVPSPGEEISNHSRGAESAVSKGIFDDSQTSGQALGRHPANLLHDGSAEVVALFPSAPGQIAPSSSSETRKNQNCYGEMRRGGPVMQPRDRQGELSAQRRYSDRGASNFTGTPGMHREPESSAARFFNAFPMTEADYTELASQGLILDLEEGVIRYNGKATRADRVFACNICGERGIGAQPACGCVDPDTGKTSVASHPTVKPIALMRWLVRLVTPPGGTVLDPFAGSGTTGSAARDEGFDCMLMEADARYAADIRARLELEAPIDIFEMLGIDAPPDPIAALGI